MHPRADPISDRPIATPRDAGLPGPWRSEFPITGSRAYLCSGGLAPAARPVSDAVGAWLERWSLDPRGIWDHLLDPVEEVRARLARLLSCRPANIAVVDGTSRASNLAVALLEAPPGSNVVVDATTYPSSLYPWLGRRLSGVEIRRAPSGWGGLGASVADFERLVDDRTVAVSITHVDPMTGFRHDLCPIADVAHRHGAVLVVDVAQSAGVLPLDPASDGFDIAAGTAMKWLLGPPGIGFLYLSDAVLARTGAPQVGYVGVTIDPSDPDRLVLDPAARRHELGLPSLLGMPGFAAGLDIVLACGVDRIAAHVERLVGRCLEGATRRGLRATTLADPTHRAGIVVIRTADPAAVAAFLRARAVDVWALARTSALRVNPHLFNDDSDIDRLLEGLLSIGLPAGRV